MTEHHPTPETEKSPAFPWLEWTNIREHLAALNERVASLLTRVGRMEEGFSARLDQIREESNTRLDQIREESNTRFTRLEGEIKDLREEVKSVKALQIGILFTLIAASGGIIAALLMK